MANRLEGVLPIVHTPFLDSGEIDAVALKREVDWAFDQGIHGLGTGMVSELLKLSTAERQWLGEQLVEFAAARGPVFISVGAESARQALEHEIVPERAGCAAV